MPDAVDDGLENALLREQLAYYRARAAEYDDSLREGATAGELADLAEAAAAIRRLAQGKDVLEVACGTGLFTRAAAEVNARLTALDAAPEMLALNQKRLRHPGVRYVLADAFESTLAETFDAVFFTFWLSHVPPARLVGFFATVRRALRPGGQVLIVDEHAGSHQRDPIEGIVHRRVLSSGASFDIVKVYYEPAQVEQALTAAGLELVETLAGQHFCRWLATAQPLHTTNVRL